MLGLCPFCENLAVRNISAIETIRKVANGIALQFLSKEELKIIQYFFGEDDVYSQASLFIKRLELVGGCATKMGE